MSAVLRAAGWEPGRDRRRDALGAVARTVSLVPRTGSGDGWTSFPAAQAALREFHGLDVPAAEPGAQVPATGCTVDPALAAHSFHTLGELGTALGVRLFPFGATGNGGRLAVDEEGRLLGVNQGGWWLYGDTVRAGLEHLATGVTPVPLRPRRHTWRLARVPGADTATDVAQTAMVLVYVLHKAAVYDTVTVHGRTTTLHGLGAPVLDEDIPLHGSLEDSAGALAARATTDAGLEVALTPLAPPGAPRPLAEVSATVTGGGHRSRDHVTVTLTTGAGACVGAAARAVDAAVAEVEAYAGRRG
ncbi:hypothetical protein SRB5_65380 [Streptomyces sp. RB5]|uniref:Uncharacterized protein n=1 Tax=Streptomyces smaragdinus TaxID=2585196 RepID=A0A7K0CSC8_9ACTN|nr:SUKH-3 domain-containing protein [Streptomyces smaragdinus]MQY16340.1 hypothetical protein [Streptomyces smaragdinus]